MSASASTAAPSQAATDAAFLPLLQSFQSSGLGGELRFVDSFFSFLRRHTALLRSGSAVEQLQAMALKHVEAAKKEAKEEKEAKAKQEEEDRKKKESEAAAAAAAAPATAAAAASASSSSPSTTELKDAGDEEDSLPPPVGNGGTTAKYSWTQTLAEVNVSIPLPAGTSAKQLQVAIEPDRLHASLKVGDKTVFVSGEPDELIDSGDATWTVESSGAGSGKTLELYLPKRNKMSWWSCVVKGDPKINTKKIVPENSKLEDLDADTRSTVEKMMFDQRQKQVGKPTSDELQKQAALKRFMEMHPEMDFSQAKFS